jgi:hypothetical protein
MVGHARRKELAEGLRGVFAAPRAGRWLCGSLPSWQPDGAGATPGSLNISKSTSRNVPYLCLAFPESHRRRIRTTNGLEGLNQEIKRRSRVE